MGVDFLYTPFFLYILVDLFLYVAYNKYVKHGRGEGMKVTVTYEANIPDEAKVYQMLAGFTTFLPFENKKVLISFVNNKNRTIRISDLVQAHAVCRENLQKLENTKVKNECSKDKKTALRQLEIICNELCFAINKDTGGPWD